MSPRNESTDTALVLLGGDSVAPEDFAGLPASMVIAADSGIDQAHRLGLDVDIAIGDFDSVSADGLAEAIRNGADVQRHATDKNATDFELALEAAVAAGVTAVTVVGGEGGRLDHLIANALLMAAPGFARLELTALGSDGSRVIVIRDRRALHGAPGELVSLLAVNGAAEGVRTEGLRFALRGERLEPGSSRGVSNELLSTEAEVSLESGVLLAVLPGPTHRQVPGDTR